MNNAKDLIRQQKRELSRENRALQRQMTNQKREEQKLHAEIKAAAKRGDMTTAKQLAKNVVRMRKQEDRMRQMSGNMKAMEHKVSAQGTTATMANAMRSMGNIMGKMNSAMDPKELQAMLKQFSMENEKMSMKEEMMESALDDAFDDEDMDEEMDEALSAIYDEIGLETSEKLGSVRLSNAKMQKAKVSDDDEEDEEVDALMQRLSKLQKG